MPRRSFSNFAAFAGNRHPAYLGVQKRQAFQPKPVFSMPRLQNNAEWMHLFANAALPIEGRREPRFRLWSGGPPLPRGSSDVVASVIGAFRWRPCHREPRRKHFPQKTLAAGSFSPRFTKKGPAYKNSNIYLYSPKGRLTSFLRVSQISQYKSMSRFEHLEHRHQ